MISRTCMGAEAYIHGRLVALAAAAGCLDAASFLGLGEVFTANQTGNTVLLGIAVGRGDWSAMARSGLSLAAFCAGVLLAALALRRAAEGWTRAVTAVLAGEAVLLVVLVALWGPAPTLVAIAVASIVMGAQSVAAQQVAVPGVTTTFVTGTLTRIVSRAVTGRGPERREATPTAAWLAYLAGAVAGAVAARVWSTNAAVVVTTAIVVVVALSADPPRSARRRPLAAAPRSRRRR